MAADTRIRPAVTPVVPLQQPAYGPQTAFMNRDTMQFNCEVGKSFVTGGIANIVTGLIPGPAGKLAAGYIGGAVGGVINCKGGPGAPPLPMPPLVPIPVSRTRGSI